MATMPKHVGAK